MSSGSNQLAFELRWNDQASTGSNRILWPNQSKEFENGSGSPTCNGGVNANIQAIINKDDIQSASTGSYSCTITLTVRAGD